MEESLVCRAEPLESCLCTNGPAIFHQNETNSRRDHWDYQCRPDLVEIAVFHLFETIFLNGY